MKNTLPSHSRISKPQKRSWIHRIGAFVKATIFGGSLLAWSHAAAQEWKSTTPQESLEQSQALNRNYMLQEYKMNGAVESLWSELKNGNSSVPNTLFDEHHTLTPEALQWISETLPKEHISLATDLVKAQEKFSELPKNSIWQKEQKLILFVSITLILAFIFYTKNEFKNKKPLEEFYKYCCTLTGKTDIKDIKAFFEGTKDDDSNEDKSADAIEADKEIWHAIHTVKLRSKLEELPENALCILTPTKGDPWYIYSMKRDETIEGTVWKITKNNKKYTMRVTTEGEIELERDWEEYAPPISTFRSLEIIDLKNANTLRRYDQHSLDNNPFGVNEWYLKECDIIESTLKTGERLLVKTYSGAIYILEVQADKTYRVLPETPNGNLSTNTILQWFGIGGDLIKQNGSRGTSQVVNMIRLDTPKSAPEKIKTATAYILPSSDDVRAMDYPELVRQLDILIKHALLRQWEEAPQKELARYQELITLFNQLILHKRPEPNPGLPRDLWEHEILDPERTIRSSFLNDIEFSDVQEMLLEEIRHEKIDPLSQNLIDDIRAYSEVLTAKNVHAIASAIRFLSKSLLSFMSSKDVPHPNHLMWIFIHHCEVDHPQLRLYMPVIDQEFDNTKMTQIGKAQSPLLRVSKILSLGVLEGKKTILTSEVECK